MRAPAIGARRRYAPRPTARVDSGHPLAAGMVACILPQYGIDILRGQLYQNVFVGNQVSTALGPGFTGALSTEFLASNAATGHLAFTSGRWTVGTVVQWLAAPVSGTTLFARISYVSGTNSQGWTLYYGSSSSLRFGSFNNTSTANDTTIATTPAAGDVMGVVGTSDGTTRYLWVDGAKSSGSTSVPNPAAVGSNGVTYGARVTSTNYAANLICCAWARTLSDREIISWQHEPFQMLRV